MFRNAWVVAVVSLIASLPAWAIQSKECTELCDCASACSKPCSFSFNGPLNHTCGEVGLCVGGFDCGGFAAAGEKNVDSSTSGLPWLATSCTIPGPHSTPAR